MLGAIALTETTLKLWKNLIEKCWKLVANDAFKYFTDDRQHTYWSVIVFRCTRIFLENWSNRCQLCTFQRIVKIFCYIWCIKVLIILYEFHWEVSFLYCFWAIKDIISFATSATVTELNVIFRNLCTDEWFVISRQVSLVLWCVLIQNFTTDRRECIYAIVFKISTWVIISAFKFSINFLLSNFL